ncbi:MAG: sugar transferase [Myxococcales bacterium]|nr:sugar transferase [Myxococcales bacterium]
MNRAADLVGVALLAPLALPLGLAATAAICVFDRGEPMFTQTRVGLGRQPFVIYKLRTMRDGQVTPVGHVLRKTGLDELPQLWNVVRGDMSLVGPRPLLHTDIARLKWDGPDYDLRWSVRPGVVGPVQLWSTRQCDARLSWVYDRGYVRQASLARDVALVGAAGLCAIFGKRRVAQVFAGWRRRSYT